MVSCPFIATSTLYSPYQMQYRKKSLVQPQLEQDISYIIQKIYLPINKYIDTYYRNIINSIQRAIVPILLITPSILYTQYIPRLNRTILPYGLCSASSYIVLYMLQLFVALTSSSLLAVFTESMLCESPSGASAI